jgi:hypothetical protein
MALIRLEDLITPEQKARTWRDNELARTDIAAMVSDFPNAEVILAYRVALRAWPSTEDFPATKPTLGE